MRVSERLSANLRDPQRTFEDHGKSQETVEGIDTSLGDLTELWRALETLQQLKNLHRTQEDLTEPGGTFEKLREP